MKLSLRALVYQLHHYHSFTYTQYYHISSQSGETWVALGGDASLVPSGTAAAHYNDWPVVNVGSVPEALTGPHWMGQGREYLAFGVDLKKVHPNQRDIVEAWPFSSFSSERDYMDPSNTGRIWPDVARKIRRDLRRAQEILVILDGRGGLPAGSLDRAYSGDNLYLADGQAAVLAELQKARKVMDERLAAIRFCLCRTKKATKTYLEHRYATNCNKWYLHDEDYRGAYLDYRYLQPDVAHVLDLLDKEVPVYFTLEPDHIPRLTPEELALAELVDTGEAFSRLFEEASPWIDEDLSLASPVKTFGMTPAERALPTMPNPNRMERFTDLCSYAHSILGNVLHSSTSPPNSPLVIPMLNIVPEALLVVEPLSEARMMIWAIESRTSEVSVLLSEALSRGWAFQVVYPEAYLDLLEESRAGVPTPAPSHFEFVSPVSETGVIRVTKEWERYLTRARILLSRPHAKAFLLLGADWMVDLLGPSSTLVDSRPSSQTIRGYYGDELSDAEKELLLGLTVSKTTGQKYYWFPPWELLVKHRFHDGEWSATEERFVMERYHSLQRGETYCTPLTREKWDLELETLALGRLQRDSFVAPDLRGVRSFLADVHTELGGSWNQSTLSAIGSTIDVDDPERWN
ncbi:hypothetical protein BC629DRAFT_1443207 [Irpex lacteus]|nr:hypothetical protein BC629DRAFT_1443207 [Irpex lacteus]